MSKPAPKSKGKDWHRPNERHWCNVCKTFTDGKPSKIRAHETAGRHQANVRLQMKAMRQRGGDQKRVDEAYHAEFAAIETAARSQLAKDVGDGFIKPIELIKSHMNASEPPRRPMRPRSPPRPSSSAAIHEEHPTWQQHQPASSSSWEPIAPPPPPTIVDEATGMGMWESVPIVESAPAPPSPPAKKPKPARQQRHQPIDVDEGADAEQAAQIADDYGLETVKAAPVTEEVPWTNNIATAQVAGMFKKRKRAGCTARPTTLV